MEACSNGILVMEASLWNLLDGRIVSRVATAMQVRRGELFLEPSAPSDGTVVNPQPQLCLSCNCERSFCFEISLAFSLSPTCMDIPYLPGTATLVTKNLFQSCLQSQLRLILESFMW